MTAVSSRDPPPNSNSNSFDDLKFLYDHLTSNKDVVKDKSIRAQKLTSNLRSYLMRCVRMTRALFEARDESEKAEVRLSQEVNKLKSDLQD